MSVPSSTVLPLRRRFDATDQARFAALSGDVNPMHVDPLAARRLLTGRQVVHGVHLLLTALEAWPSAAATPGWRIDVDFLNPVSVDDDAEFALETDPSGATRAVASVEGLPCCRIALATPAPRAPLGTADAAPEQVTLGTAPLDREPASWVGQRQRLALPAADVAAAFPRLADRIGGPAVAALALLSSYVGMVCPGLHSVFSTLSAEPGDASADGQTFEVRRFDPRLRMFIVAFEGVLRGELRAFLRPPMQDQPTTAALRAEVQPGEFAGTRHWVIGGSRGLGELIGKLAAAGGGAVTLSYARGAADAERVVQDIAAAGIGTATAMPLDLLLDDAFASWWNGAPWPDAVWYFATPRIFRKRAAFFDPALLDEFLFFYVRQFEALCQALESRAEGRTVRVFYPSTVFVDERPKGMTEYAMAKAAAEVLITDLGRRLRFVKPVARRLPRLATDQTAGLFAVGGVSNVDVLLPVMRELLSA